MMTESEILNFIRKEIAKQVNIVIAGLAGNNDQFSEDIASQYPGAPTVSGRPVMHPYGLVSRAPSGTIQTVARVGTHPGNRMVLGHRDAKRPALNSGEVQLYNAFGQAIYLKNGEVHIGIAGAADPVILGNETNQFLTAFLNLFINHTHIGNLGYSTPLNPDDMSTGEDLLNNTLSPKKLLSSYIFTDSKAEG